MITNMKRMTVVFIFLTVSLCTLLTASDGLAQTVLMPLEKYDGSIVPLNIGGDKYPVYYQLSSTDPYSGLFTASIEPTDAVQGKSLRMHLTVGALYAQWNPYDGTGRDFARVYAGCGYPPTCGNPSAWQFNTYNRLRFWIKVPPQAPPLYTDGTTNGNIGLFVKCVALPGCPDSGSDEGPVGGHYYHNINLPNTNTWVLFTMNTHPDHQRGDTGDFEQPNIPHPTGESGYNYFDTLTRFYLQLDPPSSLPVDYLLDEMVFYQEPYPENDDQVRSISVTYVPSTNRLIMSWSRNKNENTVNHEVRYAFSNIHVLGWSNATPAPNGIITPPGYQGYNAMVYNTTAINVSGQSTLYLAIKPQNSSVFSQVALPLIDQPQITQLAPPTNLRVVP